jgi:hypothetical protein
MIAIPTPIAQAGYLLYECTQGSPEWLNLRAGVITASDFAKARGRMKANRDGKNVGDPTDACLDLAFRKAIERISKVPLDENHTTWQMKRGHDLEPFARISHEEWLARKGGELAAMMVMPAGFMTTEDGVFGCSVDGLVGDNGGSEYKCLVSAAKLRKVILFNDIADYMDQVQGCMWISGREWWHFGLYCPALKPIGMEFQLIEVARDDDYIDALETDLLEFDKIVGKYEQELRAMGAQAIEEAAAEVKAMLERQPAASTNAMLAKCAGLLGTKDITPWEQSFLENVWNRSQQGKRPDLLTPPQVETLENIHAKHFA